MIARTPLKRRPRKKQPGDDPAYLRFIRSLPCELFPCLADPCQGRVEAHHAGDHGYAQRAPDRTAIPLCARHHRESTIAAHVMGKNFWPFHGLDRDSIIRELNERYDQLHV
jgi:hypothetical protein